MERLISSLYIPKENTMTVQSAQIEKYLEEEEKPLIYVKRAKENQYYNLEIVSEDTICLKISKYDNSVNKWC